MYTPFGFYKTKKKDIRVKFCITEIMIEIPEHTAAVLGARSIFSPHGVSIAR